MIQSWLMLLQWISLTFSFQHYSHQSPFVSLLSPSILFSLLFLISSSWASVSDVVSVDVWVTFTVSVHQQSAHVNINVHLQNSVLLSVCSLLFFCLKNICKIRPWHYVWNLLVLVCCCLRVKFNFWPQKRLWGFDHIMWSLSADGLGRVVLKCSLNFVY